jgi:hypothetical protein
MRMVKTLCGLTIYSRWWFLYRSINVRYLVARSLNLLDFAEQEQVAQNTDNQNGTGD